MITLTGDNLQATNSPDVCSSTKPVDNRARRSILVEKRSRNKEKEVDRLSLIFDEIIQQEIEDEERRFGEESVNTIKELMALKKKLEKSRECLAKSLADKEQKKKELADSLKASESRKDHLPQSDFSN